MTSELGCLCGIWEESFGIAWDGELRSTKQREQLLGNGWICPRGSEMCRSRGLPHSHWQDGPASYVHGWDGDCLNCRQDGEAGG